jgi:hypothetical protein
MNQYQSPSAFDAHNVGLLAAIRARDEAISPPKDLESEEERVAWQDGVSEGSAIRRACDSKNVFSVCP